MAGEVLVDRVVDGLPDQVVQARAVVHIADVHARPLADRLETFEHLDGAFTVARLAAPAAGIASLMGAEVLLSMACTSTRERGARVPAGCDACGWARYVRARRARARARLIDKRINTGACPRFQQAVEAGARTRAKPCIDPARRARQGRRCALNLCSGPVASAPEKS